jgi:hypothetical protein
MKKEASNAAIFEKKILDLVKNRKMLNFGASHALAGAGMGALGGGAIGALESMNEPKEEGAPSHMLDKVLRYGTIGAAAGGGLGASRGAGIAKKLKSEQLGQVKNLLREGINPELLHNTLQSGGHLGDLHVMDYLNKAKGTPDKLYGGALRATGFGEGLGGAIPGELDQIGLHQAQKGLNEADALKRKENRQKIWEGITGAAKTVGGGAAEGARAASRGIGAGLHNVREHMSVRNISKELKEATKKHNANFKIFKKNPNDPLARQAFEEAKMEMDSLVRQKANMVEHFNAELPEMKSKATENILNESKRMSADKAELAKSRLLERLDADIRAAAMRGDARTLAALKKHKTMLLKH